MNTFQEGMNQRRVILYIAASLDGYIAAPGDDLSFLKTVEESGEDYGYYKFLSTVDTVIMGRKTYDWVMRHVFEFPHKNLKTYIITHTPRPDLENIVFYIDSLKDLISILKTQPGKNIFIDGGAEIVNELLLNMNIDEFIISIVPLMLGKGIRLFTNDYPPHCLKLKNVKHYEKGLVQLHYEVINN